MKPCCPNDVDNAGCCPRHPKISSMIAALDCIDITKRVPNQNERLRTVGFIRQIQEGVHEGLKGPQFSIGTLQFSEEHLWKISSDNAGQIESILRKAREDIIALLSK